MPAVILMGLCAATSIPFGVWLLATSRWPARLRGPMKWPVGDRISEDVIRLQGWANALVGLASLILGALCFELPAILGYGQGRWVVISVLAVVMALVIPGTAVYLRSVRLSRP